MFGTFIVAQKRRFVNPSFLIRYLILIYRMQSVILIDEVMEMKRNKSKEVQSLKITNKHDKYIAMVVIGVILTLSLIVTLWLPENHWSVVAFNILAMLGSGVLCSAIVSWIIEWNNDKTLDKEHQRQREFFFRSLQSGIDTLIVFELLNLSGFVLLKNEGIRKSQQKKWSRQAIVAHLQEYVDQIINSIEVFCQHPKTTDSTYFDKIIERNNLAFKNTGGYYRYLDTTLSMLLSESNIYFINGVLTEQQIKGIQSVQQAIQEVLGVSEDDLDTLFEMKRLFFKELHDCMHLFEMDSDKEIRCYVKELKKIGLPS